MPSTNAALVSSLEYYMDDLVDCFEDFVKKSLLVISVALGTIILMVMYVLKVLAERGVSAPNTALNNAYNTAHTIAPNTAHNTGPNTGPYTGPNTAPKNSGTAKPPISLCREYKCTTITTAYRQEEDEPERTISDTTVESDTESTIDTKHRYNKPEPVTSNYVMNTEREARQTERDNTASFSAQVASRPSFDEKVLREIGLSSCSKPCNTSEWTVPRTNDSESRSSSNSTNKAHTQMCIAKHHLGDARPCSKYIALRTSCCSMCCVDDDGR